MRFKIKIIQPRRAPHAAGHEADEADQVLCALYIPIDNDRPMQDVWDKAHDRFHRAFQHRVVGTASFARMRTEDGADVILEDTVQELFNPSGPYDEKVLVIEQSFDNERDGDLHIPATNGNNANGQTNDRDADGFVIPPARPRQRVDGANLADSNGLHIQSTLTETALDNDGPQALGHTQAAPPTPDSHDLNTPKSDLHFRHNSAEMSSSSTHRRVPGFTIRNGFSTKSSGKDALPSPLSIQSPNTVSRPNSGSWSVREDQDFLQGMRDGLDVPRILERYGINRSESAARSHRILLRKKYPELRMLKGANSDMQNGGWIENAQPSPLRTPCAERSVLHKSSPLTSQTSSATRASRQIWHRDDLSALHKAFAEGLDVTEIQTRLFPTRTHGAILHKLRRIEDLALERARRADDWPKDDIEIFGWEDRMFFMLRRAYREGVSALEARRRWGFAVGLGVEQVQIKLDTYKRQMFEAPSRDFDLENTPRRRLSSFTVPQSANVNDDISEPDTTAMPLSFGPPRVGHCRRRTSLHLQEMGKRPSRSLSPQVIISRREQIEAQAGLEEYVRGSAVACGEVSLRRSSDASRLNDQGNLGADAATTPSSLVAETTTGSDSASVRQDPGTLSPSADDEPIVRSPIRLSKEKLEHVTPKRISRLTADGRPTRLIPCTPRPLSSGSHDERPGMQLTQELENHIASSALSANVDNLPPVASSPTRSPVLPELPMDDLVDEAVISSPIIQESSQETTGFDNGLQDVFRQQAGDLPMGDVAKPSEHIYESIQHESPSPACIDGPDDFEMLRRIESARPSVFVFQRQQEPRSPPIESAAPAPYTWDSTGQWLSQFKSSPTNFSAPVTSQQAEEDTTDPRTQCLQDISHHPNTVRKWKSRSNKDLESSQKLAVVINSEPIQVPESPPQQHKSVECLADIPTIPDVKYPSLIENAEPTECGKSSIQQSPVLGSSPSSPLACDVHSVRSASLPDDDALAVDTGDSHSAVEDRNNDRMSGPVIESSSPIRVRSESLHDPIPSPSDDKNEDNEDGTIDRYEQDLAREIQPPWPSSGQLPKSPTPTARLDKTVPCLDDSKVERRRKRKRQKPTAVTARTEVSTEDTTRTLSTVPKPVEEVRNNQTNGLIKQSEPHAQEATVQLKANKKRPKKRKRATEVRSAQDQQDIEVELPSSTHMPIQPPFASSPPLKRRIVNHTSDAIQTSSPRHQVFSSQSRLSTNDFAHMMHIP